MRVVLDTNVIVSGLNFPGNERLVLELALRGRFELYLSPFILDEVAGVLGCKFDWDEERSAQALGALGNAATVIEPPAAPTVASRTKHKTHSVPGVQREKGLSLQPPDEAANEGLITPSIGPRCVRRAYHSALARFPRGRPFGTTRAEGLTPRFLGRETLEKPDNGFIIADRSWGCPGFRDLAAQSVQSSSL